MVLKRWDLNSEQTFWHSKLCFLTGGLTFDLRCRWPVDDDDGDEGGWRYHNVLLLLSLTRRTFVILPSFLPDNKNVTIPQIYGPAEMVSGILTNTNERHFNLYCFYSFGSWAKVLIMLSDLFYSTSRGNSFFFSGLSGPPQQIWGVRMCVLSSVFSFEDTQRHLYCFTVVFVGRLRDPPRPTIIVLRRRLK